MIEKIIITSLIVFAIWWTMQEGEIFAGLGRFFERTLPDSLHKPVFDCPVCMNFWYGSLVYWIVWSNDWKEWLLVVIPGIGLNAVIVKMWTPDE